MQILVHKLIIRNNLLKKIQYLMGILHFIEHLIIHLIQIILKFLTSLSNTSTLEMLSSIVEVRGDV